MENPILMHSEAARGEAFGDRRLVKRGRLSTKQ